MPSLEPYSRALEYSYAPGLFPATECAVKRPELMRRLLVHPALSQEGDARSLIDLCLARGVRVETAERALKRVSGKDNCYAAMVFHKFSSDLSNGRHIVLHHPSDQGNLGTILRTALGFGYLDVAIIRPAADPFDPRVVRASMGALFGLRLRQYDSFEDYRAEHPDHALFPFMLTGSVPLSALRPPARHALVFGHEGAGLPAEFAQLGQAVRIGHSREIDSLNLAVAAAIGMRACSDYREG